MIRYALVCSNDHPFESWFQDSAAFDGLEKRGQLACPMCGSSKVGKALMAPSVLTSRRRQDIKPPAGDPSPAALPSTGQAASPPAVVQPATLLSEKERHLRDMLRAVHREITEKSENVGRAFAIEARRIHEGDGPARSIYGEASRDEVEALLDDGIPLLPMPVLPDDHN